ncbi:hypothetical protein QOT17_002108 [Balamuthia mandrillaris]
MTSEWGKQSTPPRAAAPAAPGSQIAFYNLQLTTLYEIQAQVKQLARLQALLQKPETSLKEQPYATFHHAEGSLPSPISLQTLTAACASGSAAGPTPQTRPFTAQKAPEGKKRKRPEQDQQLPTATPLNNNNKNQQGEEEEEKQTFTPEWQLFKQRLEALQRNLNELYPRQIVQMGEDTLLRTLSQNAALSLPEDKQPYASMLTQLDAMLQILAVANSSPAPSPRVSCIRQRIQEELQRKDELKTELEWWPTKLKEAFFSTSEEEYRQYFLEPGQLTKRPYLKASALVRLLKVYNPELAEGDILHVPFSPEEESTVKSSGIAARSERLNLLHLCKILPGRTMEDLIRYLEDLESGTPNSYPEVARYRNSDNRFPRLGQPSSKKVTASYKWYPLVQKRRFCYDWSRNPSWALIDEQQKSQLQRNHFKQFQAVSTSR